MFLTSSPLTESLLTLLGFQSFFFESFRLIGTQSYSQQMLSPLYTNYYIILTSQNLQFISNNSSKIELPYTKLIYKFLFTMTEFYKVFLSLVMLIILDA